MFTLGGITITVLILRFIIFEFQESPTFLLYRGKDRQAFESLQYIARYNKRKCHLTSEAFASLTDEIPPADSESRPLLASRELQTQATFLEKAKLELQRYKALFSSFDMVRLVVLVYIIYGFDFWAFNIAGSFLPIILQRKGTKLGLSLKETYRSYIYIYILGIPGVLAGSLIYGRRRVALVVSSVLFGACLFAFTAVSSQTSYVSISALV